MGVCAKTTTAEEMMAASSSSPSERVVAAQTLLYRGIGLLVSAGVMLLSLSIGLSFSMGFGSAFAIAIGATTGLAFAGRQTLRRGNDAMAIAMVSMDGTAIDDSDVIAEALPETCDIKHPTISDIPL